jgi:hypothetical protein
MDRVGDYRGLLCFQDLPALPGFRIDRIEVVNADNEGSISINTRPTNRVLLVLIEGSFIICSGDSSDELIDMPDSMFMLRRETEIVIKGQHNGSTALIVYYGEI